MSGHSKWASIKHKKGAADAKRGKLFSKLIKEIQVAAKLGGGNPDGNPRLRKSMNDARAAQMGSDTIQRAIKRGTGELEGTQYEEILYEGNGPGGVLFLMDVMTDNRNRTVAELRKIFERNNGSLAGGGSALWAFERKGIITLARDAATEEQLMEIAVGAGADDYSDEGEEWQILTDVAEMESVVSALEEAGITVANSIAGYVPKSKKPLTGKDAYRALTLFELLDDHEDCQNVFADFDVSDDEMARIMNEE